MSKVDIAKNVGSKIVESLGEGAAMAAGTIARPVIGAGKMIGDNFLRYDEKFYNDGLWSSLFGVRLNKKGYAAVAGIGLALGAKEAGEEYNRTQMGAPPEKLETTVPEMSYTHFGMETGATGDLVFAMNRNRRG